MQTFDQSIFQLMQGGHVSKDEALRRASNPDEFKLRLSGVQSSADAARQAMESALETRLPGEPEPKIEGPDDFSLGDKF
jgi:twitching motility protein PilT